MTSGSHTESNILVKKIEQVRGQILGNDFVAQGRAKPPVWRLLWAPNLSILWPILYINFRHFFPKPRPSWKTLTLFDDQCRQYYLCLSN